MYVPGIAITISLFLQNQKGLLLASRNGHVKVVEMLLSKGANVDYQEDEVSMEKMGRWCGDHMGGMEMAFSLIKSSTAGNMH